MDEMERERNEGTWLWRINLTPGKPGLCSSILPPSPTSKKWSLSPRKFLSDKSVFVYLEAGFGAHLIVYVNTGLWWDTCDHVVSAWSLETLDTKVNHVSSKWYLCDQPCLCDPVSLETLDTSSQLSLPGSQYSRGLSHWKRTMGIQHLDPF
jgi:hypothetical protein